MSYVKNILLIHGLMFIILTIPVSFSHFDFAFSQRNGPHFGNEGQGGAGGQLGQGGAGGQLGQGGAGGQLGQGGAGGQLGQGGAGCSTGPNGIGGAGCPTGSKDTVSSTDNTITRGQGGAGCSTGPNGIGGAGCPTGSKDTVSSTDNTNNVVVADSSSTDSSSTDSSSTDSSSTDSSSTDSSLVGKTYIIHGPTDKTGGNPYSSTASCHTNDLILGGGSIYDITDGNVTSFSAIPDSLSTFTTKITSSSNSDSALTVQAYAICYDNP
jgi:hypothetical protein